MDIIRVGRVSSVDEKNVTARVVFEDRDSMVSDDLNILMPFTMKDKMYFIPAINEQVLCIMIPNGTSKGYIAGSIYNASDKPSVQNKDKFHIKFEDDTTIEYDKNTHTLKIDCKGNINLFTSGKCNIKSELYVDGDINAKGAITANVQEAI